MKKLIFERINDMDTYRIYDEGIDLGEMTREIDGKWYLTIPCADIHLVGQYRYDLMEQVEIEYTKFVNKHKIDQSIYSQLRKEIIEAYVFLRKNNHTIPDTTLDFMKNAALKELNRNFS